MISDILSINLEEPGDVIITAPRRSGKTTFLKELIIKYSPKDVLLVAPQSYFGMCGFKAKTTVNSIRGLDPKIILVEEAAYCKDETIYYLDLWFSNRPNNKLIYTGTPKEVNYKWNNKEGIWICDCAFKTIIDKRRTKHYYPYSFDVYAKKQRQQRLEEKDCYTKSQWKTEFLGEWVENYIRDDS